MVAINKQEKKTCAQEAKKLLCPKSLKTECIIKGINMTNKQIPISVGKSKI